MKKVGYYKYEQPIYPHVLCVGIGLEYEDAKRAFQHDDKDELIDYDFKECDGITCWELHTKDDGRRCILVLFENRKCMTISLCCHEATHACEHIEQEIGMEHGGEASAYLAGWIAKCIDEARKGNGEFIEIKD